MVYGECGQLPGETPLDEPISLSPPLSRVSLAAYCHKLNTFADLLLRRLWPPAGLSPSSDDAGGAR